MRPILVQLSNRAWTMQAMHLACAIARSNNTRVVLLRLVPVPVSYLGTGFGVFEPNSREQWEIEEYLATAEDYQVACSLQSMPSIGDLGAIADAARQLDAAVVFAHVPQAWIPLWHRFLVWRFRRTIAHSNRRLFTLEPERQPQHLASSVELQIDGSAFMGERDQTLSAPIRGTQ